MHGIYKITNKVNGKIYVGSSINVFNRWRVHKCCLINNEHHSILLQRAWNRHGEQNFVFEVVEEVSKKEKLIEREQHYLDVLKPEYNICKIAGNTLGFKHSEEAKQKISASLKGEKNHNFGKHRSEEARQKLSEAQKGEKNHNFGKHRSEETKQKISEALTGEKHPFYGKTFSEEHRQKLSESKKGKYPSEETKQKMSEAKKGENNISSKLMLKQVYEIREKYIPKIYSYGKLAKEYGVTKRAIINIVQNKTWKQ